MKAKMDEKQIKALECLDELTVYASENRLPMRIMDELEECKKQISSTNVDWIAVNLTMEGLLNSIELKLIPQAVQKESHDNEVTVDMVKEQVEKMAGRCHADNVTSIESMTKRKNTVIKMNCEQLVDISQTKVHLEELKNGDLYLQFFQKCKTKYEKDAYEMFRELLQSISENYNHMLNHMKSMFQSISGYKNGISSEKFYYEYEERRTGIDQRVQGELQTVDIGGNDIMSLGRTTKQTVKAIVKKLSRKKKFLAWLPLLILFCFLAVGTAGKMVEKQNEAKQAGANAENEDSFLKNVVKNVAEAGFEKATSKTVSAASSKLIVWLIPIVIVLVLIYLLYLKMINAWCNRQICEQCGEYLRTELLQFEQKNELSFKLETAMENAAEEYERQYMEVLNNLFRNSLYHTENTEQTGKKSKFDSLRAEWHRVCNI